jgi:hypothetical protein
LKATAPVSIDRAFCYLLFVDAREFAVPVCSQRMMKSYLDIGTHIILQFYDVQLHIMKNRITPIVYKNSYKRYGTTRRKP